MYYELTDGFIVSADIEATWKFFSSAKNLPLITPEWLKFAPTAPGPQRIELNSRLDYTIRWMGIPVCWRTKIIDWCPPRQFIDLQVRGPYALWHHQHTFLATSQGVECRDRVIYRLPVPGVGWALHSALIRRQLIEIFRFRRRAVGDQLGWVGGLQEDVEIRRL